MCSGFCIFFDVDSTRMRVIKNNCHFNCTVRRVDSTRMRAKSTRIVKRKEKKETNKATKIEKKIEKFVC
jgi:hypothetical protein